MFIANIWYAAAWCSEVQVGKPMALTIANRPIVLYRAVNGQAVALEDRCSHRCAPLSKGRVEGDALRCGYHGLLFSRAGKCLEMPGQENAAGFDIQSYPVVERHECIWVWTGESSRADDTLVPQSRLTENGLAFRTGALEYSSDYQLINDNLCDFSHVAYVHEKTFGQGQTEWAQQLPTLSNLDNGIRVTRWIEGATMPPTPGIDPGLRIDQYTAYDYVVPGVLTMQVEAHPLGTAKRLAFQPPPASMDGAMYVMRTLQMATPISDGRARYMYGVSHPVDPAIDQSLDGVVKLFAYAFVEDKDMIEAQQRSIEKHPSVVLRATKHDTGLMRVRRLISRMILDERQVAPAGRVRSSAFDIPNADSLTGIGH